MEGKQESSGTLQDIVSFYFHYHVIILVESFTLKGLLLLLYPCLDFLFALESEITAQEENERLGKALRFLYGRKEAVKSAYGGVVRTKCSCPDFSLLLLQSSPSRAITLSVSS